MPSAPTTPHRTCGRRGPLLLAAFAWVAAGVPLLTAAPAAAADPVTFVPNGGAVQHYTVPAGVTSVEVLAVGGTGGRGGAVATESRAPGGRGGTVLTTIPVTEGEIIDVVVGANGEGTGQVPGGAAGTPRGGEGGGRSTVMTCRSSSPCPDDGVVLLYAGGGGGGGGRGVSGPGTNGGAGASVGAATGGNGTTGVVYVSAAQGGASGTDAPGGGGARGLVTDCTGSNGFDGGTGVVDGTGATTPGKGGNGAADGGGGGGGGGDGYRPGGGGGGGAGCASSSEADGGGAGGGAGSSHVDGADATFGTDTTATPRVVITPVGGPPVDTTAPTVTVDQASGQADPTSASPIRFTAAFSEPVAALTTSDITLAGATGGTVSTVTDGGDHQTFTIDVTGMTTAGTVTASISAGATTDTAGNPNTASTSTDDVVTYEPPVVAPPPTLQIAPRVDVLEGRTAQLALTLSAPATAPITVQLATADGPLFGGASASQWLVPDYVGGPRTVTIPAGSTTATVNVATNVDFSFDSWETFTVRITSASGDVQLGNRAGTVTVWDAIWWWLFPQ